MCSTYENTDTNIETDHQQIEEATLATLSLALSRGLWTPRDMTGDTPEALRSLPDELLGAAGPAVNSLANAWDEALTDRAQLSISFAKLFLGPFEILAPPYASFYLEPDQRLMGQVSNWVAEQYADAGLKPGAGPREVPDHAALEWEFVYFLTHRLLETGDAQWRRRRQEFLTQHLSQWMPAFCEAISAASTHVFYSTWAACVPPVLRRFKEMGD